MTEDMQKIDISHEANLGIYFVFGMKNVNLNSLKKFTQSNMNVINNHQNQLLVLSWEIDELDEISKHIMNTLIQNHFFELVKGDGYDSLFTKFNQKSDEILYLSTSTFQHNTIAELAKSYNCSIDFAYIGEDGTVEKKMVFVENHSEDKEPDPIIKQNDLPKKVVETNNKFSICDKLEKINIRSIDCKPAYEGMEIIDSNNTSYIVGPKVMKSNNASLYTIEGSDNWVKLYDPSMLNTFVEAKIKRMLSKPVNIKNVCWPISIVKDSDGNFRGYILPSAEGEPLLTSVFKKAGIEKYHPDWNKASLCDLTITILKMIRELRDQGILLGCLNPAAIRIMDTDQVYFIDTDNFQVEGFPSFTYNVSFSAPENLDKKIYLATEDSENFSIALLVFMIMMTGKTPYVVGNEADPVKKIKKMNFQYAYREKHNNVALPGMWRFMWSHLTPLKGLFYETFQKNGKYNNPGTRRSLNYWIHKVKEFRKELENPVDPQSLELYPQTFKRAKNQEFYECSFCHTMHPRFYFSDEYFDTPYRICNSCLNRKSNVSFTCHCCGKTYYYTNGAMLFHRRKKIEDGWKDQKYCKDCKKKTEICPNCGKKVPYYKIREGHCPNCNNETYRQVRCKDCGKVFNVTYREHEYFQSKGWSDPIRCPDCRGGRRNSRNNINNKTRKKNEQPKRGLFKKLFGI